MTLRVNLLFIGNNTKQQTEDSENPTKLNEPSQMEAEFSSTETSNKETEEKEARNQGDLLAI